MATANFWMSFTNTLLESNSYLKKAKLNNSEEVQAIIDTGSSFCLLRTSVAQKLKVKPEPALNELYSFGNQRVPAVTSIGMIKADIEVDNVKGQGINIYLVPDNAQPVDLIIGRTWLDLPHIAYVRIGKRFHFAYREDELFSNLQIDEKINRVCLKALEENELEKNSPYAANRNRHCGQLFSKHHFMPKQRQNVESDSVFSQSQENVDDKQQIQPQRPVRRQLCYPYFRQYCGYLSIALPRNVGRDGREDEQKERKTEKEFQEVEETITGILDYFIKGALISKIHYYHRNDTECSQSRMEGEATSKYTEANDDEKQQPRGQGARSCPHF
ncbi:uncharacterized protein LOC118191955 [Stegodyphus dumicola]|uniref:uncharacterized protein LOC118191955 n=1 Tax=Stegodyphus dumicola TaxID=202533 RepID=UPI0015A921E8|nr:uncharacterized protein LOC118191955 [Stegodyphus dumicola]